MNIAQQLNSFLQQERYLDFQNLLEKSYQSQSITEDIYFKFQGFKNFKLNSLEIAINFFNKSNNARESFDTHLNIAVSYLKLNDYPNSELHFEKSLEINSKFEDTYILYSKLLRNQKKDNKALEILQKGLRQSEPQNLKVMAELADYQREKHDFLEAISNYSKILKRLKNNYVILNSMAVCYETIGESILAEQSYQKALKINPNYFEALSNYGNLLRSIGKNDEALMYFEKCISSRQNRSQIFRYISILKKFKKEKDTHIQQMLDYEQSSDFHKDDKQFELYFALSKVYEDLKEQEKFSKYLLLANKKRRQSISDERIQKEFEFFDLIKDTFSEKIVNNFKPELDGSNIILVIGMPRSGTTLVEQILGSHSKVRAGGEQMFFQNLLRKNFNFFEKISFQDDFAKHFEANKNNIGNEYLKKLNEMSGKKITTDKLPFNFFYIGFFLGIFKNIKIINLSRNPMDNCFSIFKNFFAEEINFAYDQNELAKYYKKYKELMNYWNLIFPNRIFNLEYEKLIDNQEKVTKELLEYCKLDWENSCLEFYKSQTSVRTLSTAQVRNPIYKTSVKSWEKYKDVLSDLNRGLNN